MFLFSFFMHFFHFPPYNNNSKQQTTVTISEICHFQHVSPQWEGFPFLPEWFESEKTSPHHNEKVGAGCDHFPHTYKEPGLLSIVRLCATTGVTTITLDRSHGARDENMQLPRTAGRPCCALRAQLQEYRRCVLQKRVLLRFLQVKTCVTVFWSDVIVSRFRITMMEAKQHRARRRRTDECLEFLETDWLSHCMCCSWLWLVYWQRHLTAQTGKRNFYSHYLK